MYTPASEKKKGEKPYTCRLASGGIPSNVKKKGIKSGNDAIGVQVITYESRPPHWRVTSNGLRERSSTVYNNMRISYNNNYTRGYNTEKVPPRVRGNFAGICPYVISWWMY